MASKVGKHQQRNPRINVLINSQSTAAIDAKITEIVLIQDNYIQHLDQCLLCLSDG